MPANKDHPEQDPAEGSREVIDRQLKESDMSAEKNKDERQKDSGSAKAS